MGSKCSENHSALLYESLHLTTRDQNPRSQPRLPLNCVQRMRGTEQSHCSLVTESEASWIRCTVALKT